MIEPHSILAPTKKGELAVFSALIEVLYSGLWQEQGMNQSLTQLKKHFNCCSATLVCLQNNPRQMKYGWSVGVPENHGQWYIENGMVAKDPSVDLFAIESPKRQGFVAASEFLAGIALVDCVSEDFKPWLVDEKIVDTAGLFMTNGDNESIMLVLQRDAAAGVFSEQDMHQLNLLTSHIKQMLQLFLRFYRQQGENASLQAAINGLLQPTIVFNKLLQVIYINDAAKKQIALCRSAMRLEHDVLTLNDEKLQQKFMFSALNMVSRRIEDLSHFNAVMHIPCEFGNIIFSMSMMLDSAQSESSRGMLLQIYMPQNQQMISSQHIQKSLQVSKAEAEVCTLLTQGYAVQEIAEQRNVSVNTVREQLRKIYRKTHTTRQSELISTILRIGTY